MILTTKGRYAVMALADIAKNGVENDGDGCAKPVSLIDIANRQGITVAYLEQIFSRLKAKGLVKSVRGPGGGYMLINNVAEVHLHTIMHAAEEKIKITNCHPNGKSGCMKKGRCITHNLWADLDKHINSYLSSVTLEDICNGRFKVGQC